MLDLEKNIYNLMHDNLIIHQTIYETIKDKLNNYQYQQNMLAYTMHEQSNGLI